MNKRQKNIFEHLSISTLIEKTVLKNEIVEVTAKSSDTFMITRSFGTCPWSDNSTTQWSTAYQFDADDYFFMNNVVEILEDIQNEVETIVTTELPKKLDVTEYQQWQYVYGASSTWNDDYVITLPKSPTAYETWQVFRFQADVENSWPATLNVNWLWSITIKKMHDQDVETGDIEAWQIVVVAYDWTNFQMNSQVAIIPEAETSQLIEQKIVVGESGIAWDVFLQKKKFHILKQTKIKMLVI